MVITQCKEIITFILIKIYNKTDFFFLKTYNKCGVKTKCFHHIFSTKYVLPDQIQMIAIHQNVVNCQITLTVLTMRWKIFLEGVELGWQMSTRY